MENITEQLLRFNYMVSEINRQYHEAALKLGLSDSTFVVLYTVCNEGVCGISDVCRLTGVSKQTVNSALRKLESDGIIELAAVDGKQKRIALTAKGKCFTENTAIRIVEAENHIFGNWKENDRIEYLRLTERYLNDFKKEVSKL